MLTEKQIRDKIVDLHNEIVKIRSAIKTAEQENKECDMLYIAHAEQVGRIGALEDVLRGEG